MKNYIVKEATGELTIMQVKPEQESAFLAAYEDSIVACGSSIQEVIIKFGELMKRN
ncbi:hypothetical protein ACTJJ0_21360 [Chitinophaga sp. 22321]|uniref:Uncharacterized protein n=1 Tax=Chitinophaga hostae TaxID=2831022 RepID=A0ABS5J4Q4_9BACT|nr:hypothetical protein [Chitinophaga hostae]MBS0030036.1 hypothetical protein [Chitinophaga hostae]